MNLEVLKVGNGTSNYPGDFTKKEQNLIKYACKGYVINLFSGRSLFGNIRVDFSCQEATHHMDVFKYLRTYKLDYKNCTVILDPPYNKRNADKYQKLGNTSDQFVIFTKHVKQTRILFDLIREKINPGIIIMKSWNFYIPKGYKLKKGYLCYPGGYRKSTILLILEKIGEC